MLAVDDARKIVDVIVGARQAALGVDLVVLEPPQEFAQGWLFLYDSKDYVQTGNISSAIAGNGPIAVFSSGEVQLLGTADSVDILLRRLNERDLHS
ncbi:YrhB domain-containing protein [uncultured Jatrophihabitans sp.]|uniref:YrhB domain-containing protein n=1 Tax=uncultured Jatrophihabitans sp. TaxID=1610747 RepID=UPI0035C97C38